MQRVQNLNNNLR